MNKMIDSTPQLREPPEMRKTEEIRIIEIAKIVEETKDIKTLIFNYPLKSLPGQFIEIWIPGTDEKPYSISYQDNERFGVTVFTLGPFSKKLNSLKAGDKVGIRGPYGRPFTVKRCNAVLVGGGCGSAPLAFLANELKKAGAKVDFITGARTKDLLLFEDRMKTAGINYYPCTNDGSHGVQGFTTDLLNKILSAAQNIDKVYTCGPEVMMKKVLDFCEQHSIECEISMERFMKCGFGICGQCCLDNTGQRVCADGPVMTNDEVKKTFEFGKYARAKSGKKKAFNQQ